MEALIGRCPLAEHDLMLQAFAVRMFEFITEGSLERITYIVDRIEVLCDENPQMFRSSNSEVTYEYVHAQARHFEELFDSVTQGLMPKKSKMDHREGDKSDKPPELTEEGHSVPPTAPDDLEQSINKMEKMEIFSQKGNMMIEGLRRFWRRAKTAALAKKSEVANSREKVAKFREVVRRFKVKP